MEIAEKLGIAHQSISTKSITFHEEKDIFLLGNWQNACLVQFPEKYIKTGFIG